MIRDAFAKMKTALEGEINVFNHSSLNSSCIKTDKYGLGVHDLLVREQQNVAILMQMAKSVTKGVCEITNENEALDYLFAYIDDIHTLLNKRHLTKELLFKYLHKYVPSTSTNFTKSDIIRHIIEYWDYAYSTKTECCTKNSTDRTPDAGEYNATSSLEPNFPINLMARKFSEWFFDNYNRSNLKLADFWCDTKLNLSIIANDGVDEHNCIGAEQTIRALMESKCRFDFHFNPNLTHEGVQGRMEQHGLVLVLACGTLHTHQQFVGIFECVFGLLRDPFAENNWKAKSIHFVLRSQPMMLEAPSLVNSNSLKKALTLPTSSEELS